MTLPLAGVCVLDLSRVLAGPVAAQLLGDMGAEVVKVERPGHGDDSRHYGPAYMPAQAPDAHGESAFFLCANRNKRSVTIDFTGERGRALVIELAKRSDVVIENYRTGVLARKGLGYADLAAVNPRLVYCSVTGFGQTGPYAERPGYDGIFQAMSGLMAVTGAPDGTPGAGPTKVGPSIVDAIAGYNAVAGILAALYHRDTVSGVGQHLDIALFDCAVAAQTHYVQQYLTSGQNPVRRGSQGNGGLPSGVFHCADGAFLLAVGNDRQFAAFCEIIGRADMAADPRFRTIAARSANRAPLTEAVEAAIAGLRMQPLLDQLAAREVPAGPVNAYSETFADPQALARGIAAAAPHPHDPAARVVASPIRLSATPLDRYRAPPLLGADTDAVLGGELGLGADEIASLRADGVI